MPCMMCTCCAAPIVGTLRRNGAPTSSVLAYWLGNPTLNPAVLAFLAIVAPWQWFATRLAVGVVLVFAVTVLIDRLAAKRDAPPSGDVPAAPADDGLRAAPRRFVRSLARLSLTLVPEYAVVVFTLGALRGWLFPFEGDATQWGILAVAAAAVLGTLVVVPTAGEIPILLGLAAAGAGAGVVGALLITLPAISLPSMIMVMRELSWRVTAAAGTAVAVAGLAAGGLLWTLG
ncbi:permease [Actinomadura madurae]|nr:permease [Actinomadura madurae]